MLLIFITVCIGYVIAQSTGCPNENQVNTCSAQLTATNCFNSTGSGNPYCPCFPLYFSCLQAAGCSSSEGIYPSQVESCQQMCTLCEPKASDAVMTVGTSVTFLLASLFLLLA
jgi:hypothetical protein